MQTRQPAVRFRNVSKRFKMTSSRPQTVLETLISFYKRRPDPPADQELWAVNDLSFTLLQGESLGIIGRNGSGKSTILKLIARILRPTSGEILVRGRVSALLELGAGFHPDLTGRENIYLNASVLGLNRAEIEERFDSIVEFSELASFIDVPVKHYSSGMYMRLGFSVAVHVEPDILLIDEILAVGDQAFQEKCFERIWEMKRQGTTIVLVSHHTQTVRNLCTDALWIEYGEVRAAGQAQEVLSQYTSFYAQRKKDARATEDGSFPRWGTGEVKVTDVRLLDENGELTTTFKTGGTATLAIDYETERVVRQAHFAVAIHTEDGVRISGPNQHQFANGSPLPAQGTVTYRINYLPLLAGTYHFTVAVHDGHSDHAFDHHEQAYEFHVVGKDAVDRQGFVEVPASWEWAGRAIIGQDASAARDEEVERAGSYN